jgi:adenylate kinase
MAVYTPGMGTSQESDRSAWLLSPSAKCSTIAEASNNTWRLVLLGAPGVGKGTQAEILKQRLGACHLSTGDVFRAAKQQDADKSPAMQAALEYMRRGELVPDATVWEMVRERKNCLLHCRGFILDGFPRTLGQAASLKGLMETEKLQISAVVDYELPVDEIVRRLSGRRNCEQCKSVFHITERPPKLMDVCDQCGAQLYQREDDRPEAITVRLETYERSTAPLIKFYGELGLLLPISAQGSPEEIFARTMRELESWQANSSIPQLETPTRSDLRG